MTCVLTSYCVESEPAFFVWPAAVSIVSWLHTECSLNKPGMHGTTRHSRRVMRNEDFITFSHHTVNKSEQGFVVWLAAIALCLDFILSVTWASLVWYDCKITWNLSSPTWNSVQKRTENFSSMTLSVPFFSVRLIFFSCKFLQKRKSLPRVTQQCVTRSWRYNTFWRKSRFPQN